MNVRLACFRVIRGNVTRASPGHVIPWLRLAKGRHRPWLGRWTGSMATVAPSPVLHNTTAPYPGRPGRYLAWSIHDRAVDNARLDKADRRECSALRLLYSQMARGTAVEKCVWSC